MRRLLNKLMHYSLIVFPLMGNSFNTDCPECDGIIKYADGKYSYCSVEQRFESEDEACDKSFHYVVYNIDLPGKVIYHYLHRRQTTLFLEDGSAMSFYTWYIGGDKIGNYVLGNEAVKQFDKKTLNKYLDIYWLINHLYDIVQYEQIDPQEWLEPYVSYYQANNYRKNLLKEIMREDYDKLNFKISFVGMDIECFNVPVSSFQKYIKSIASLQIIIK